MDRKTFLRDAGFASGAGLTLPVFTKNTDAILANSSLDTWTEIRNQFPLEKGKVHMAQMLLASHPKPVRGAIDYHRKQFDANPAEYWEHNFETAEPKVLQAAASYLKAKPAEIALTDSTTQGLGILYTGLKLNRGDEILTTTHDHYSTEKSLEYTAQKTGASINRISLYDDPASASVDEIVGRLTEAVTLNTKFIAVTWVHSSTGVKLPIRKLSDALNNINKQRTVSDKIYLSVDGVHGLGIENITMDELGCDFFIAGTHKWLFGPRGTGFVWAKKDA
jgi:selenocysteine lyase/cysteine desulfurase